MVDASTQGTFCPRGPPGLERQKMQFWFLEAAGHVWYTHSQAHIGLEKPPWKPS